MHEQILFTVGNIGSKAFRDKFVKTNRYKGSGFSVYVTEHKNSTFSSFLAGRALPANFNFIFICMQRIYFTGWLVTLVILMYSFLMALFVLLPVLRVLELKKAWEPQVHWSTFILHMNKQTPLLLTVVHKEVRRESKLFSKVHLLDFSNAYNNL